MRGQYKVLAEKYNLVSEGPPGWDIHPTDDWYKTFKRYKLPYFEEFIMWLNNYSKEWAMSEWSLDAKNVSQLLDRCYDHNYDLAGDDRSFIGVTFKDVDNDEDLHELLHKIAMRNTIKEIHDFGFLPWWEHEQKRQAIFNKDNPGIEMDI